MPLPSCQPSYLRDVHHSSIGFPKSAKTLFLAGLALLSNCRSGPDETLDAHAPQAPATMMAPLHTMAQHAQALPLTSNLDLYFARLMRENHRAAVAMSALELQRGSDPALRPIAQDIHRAHQRLVVGLDSIITRIQAQPPAFPEHTTKSHELAKLLEAAIQGLPPAAHRVIGGAEGDATPRNDHREPPTENAGTGSIDRDYAALLVPHHENSIALARAELQFGRDEALQKAAFLVLQDQQREIEQVQTWLRQHPAKAK